MTFMIFYDSNFLVFSRTCKLKKIVNLFVQCELLMTALPRTARISNGVMLGVTLLDVDLFIFERLCQRYKGLLIDGVSSFRMPQGEQRGCEVMIMERILRVLLGKSYII